MRWGMVIDLEKCTGCQTCTVACKVENGLGPTIQRVTVLENEEGKFPDVKRVFIPKRCMNCGDPLCLSVCPSGATEQGDDGIVTINREKCIGCRYCIMACPYNVRVFYAVEQSYHNFPSRWEIVRYKEHTTGVVEKCDFCKDRIDYGLKNNLQPGKDPDATPFCVIACIAKALTFGDLDNPASEVSIQSKSRGVQMLPEMKTDPSVYYLPRRF
ncbi:MAG: 4Fe-4S dicluster domain-containing protein [Spirochaetota bacterium]